MARRASQAFEIYRGDDFNDALGIHELGGGVIGEVDGGPNSGGQISTTNNQLILPSGVQIKAQGQKDRGFVAGDVGKKVTLITGAGIADGRTITAVTSATQATISGANSTATRTDCCVLLRGLDLSVYTITAQVRSAPGQSVLFNLPVLTARLPYGILQFRIPSKAYALANSLPSTIGGLPAITDDLTAGGQYDIQFIETATGLTLTPVTGKVTVTPDITRAA